MSTTQTWMSEFTQRQAALPGAGLPWLDALRQRAIERFAEEGWPTTRQEAWRHTSLAALELTAFKPTQAQVNVENVLQDLKRQDEGHWMVFVDGRYAPSHSTVSALPDGIRILPVSELLAQDPAALEGFYGQESDGSSPVALNIAFASDGAYIDVARGVEIEQPIHLVFISASPDAASFVRNFVRAEAGSRAHIMEHYLGQDSGASLSSAVTRMDLAQDAHVTQLKLQLESPDAFHLGAIDVVQARGSVFNSHSVSFGAKLARHDIGTRFTGDHCESLLNGLYYANGKRHVDHHTLIDHAQPHGTSREFYRGILNDTARGVFSGRILVAPGADKTDAVQRSDSLLLSRLAKADARPELEIYADDVKCAHGATVGQISEDSLFYLRSRGLDEPTARSVLTYAFAAQAVERIEPIALRQRVIAAIQRLVPGGVTVGEA